MRKQSILERVNHAASPAEGLSGKSVKQAAALHTDSLPDVMRPQAVHDRAMSMTRSW